MSETPRVASPEAVDRAREFLAGIVERMQIEAEIKVEELEDKVVLDIVCEEPSRLVGKRGQIIDALQHLIGKVAFTGPSQERRKPIIVDAGGYRAKHIEKLQQLAERMCEKAMESGEIIELNPMSAHDRRIVHMALAERAGVSTRSEGEGDDRHVLVVPDAEPAEASAE